ncbi:MAG TPA: hypothetical protein VK450_00015, partial [Methanomicrobiales archaeon]|nr:hypothetical protein [Methanomicrobiales archaeon]
VHEFRKSGKIEEAIIHCLHVLRGSYSVILMLDGTLYAFRDPMGIKPLCIGTTKTGFVVASESVAIDTLGGTLLRDVAPGELFRITEQGFEPMQIAIAYNGNLVNSEELRNGFEADGEIFSTTTDTEIVAATLVHEFRKSGKIEEAIIHCLHVLRGSYSVVLMLDGTLYAFRDPVGIKPLCIGTTTTGFVVASESVAIDTLGGTLLRDVAPGELFRITEQGFEPMQIAVADRKAHCIFEYIYFARADSVIEGRLVYDIRRQIGASLYDEAPVKADLVSPVPDSGTSVAIGFAHHSGIPYLEALMKNRYTARTFIKPSQKERELAVRLKLNPITGHI